MLHNINKEQIRVALSIMFAAGGPASLLIMKHFGLTADEMNLWAQLVLLIGPGVISLLIEVLKNTNRAKVVAAAAVPDVEKVVVRDNASQPLTDAAADSGQTKVVTSKENKE